MKPNISSTDNDNLSSYNDLSSDNDEVNYICLLMEKIIKILRNPFYPKNHDKLEEIMDKYLIPANDDIENTLEILERKRSDWEEIEPERKEAFQGQLSSAIEGFGLMLEGVKSLIRVLEDIMEYCQTDRHDRTFEEVLDKFVQANLFINEALEKGERIQKQK